eukprot:scaffold123543_cov33-Prasinocladus_malaysianus.AAC.2
MTGRRAKDRYCVVNGWLHSRQNFAGCPAVARKARKHYLGSVKACLSRMNQRHASRLKSMYEISMYSFNK